ncbi:peptidylprolyl isomerase [Chelatococcus sp. GCM10030263]|uniref:peptidylprolyl isomerase n=1 Tax=Chelatococcus sp. GCM10030263 TaxID=3273387 RepID=UPI00360FD39E
MNARRFFLTTVATTALAVSAAVSLPAQDALAQTGTPAQTPAAQAPAAQAPAAQAPAAQSPAPEKPLALVNGVPITQKDLDMASEDLGDRLPAMPDAQRRTYLVNYLIDMKILAQAAEKAKIADTPDFARRMAYYRDKVMLDDYLASEVKKAATPEAARKLYEETIKTMKPEEEVRARHILVESEDDAKKIAARVKGGEDFVKVATEVSKDPGSAKDGGDLGFFTKDRMVPEFAEVAFKLKPGEISDPVKTQFGWHVIKVEEKREKPVPTFEEVKDQVDSYLAQKTQQDIILALRKDAKIERFDEPSPAPATPAEPKKP